MSSELWQRIRAVRKHLALSQEAFGALFEPEVSKAAVSQWESAKPETRTRPDLLRLSQMSARAGAPLSWLLSDASDVDAEWWQWRDLTDQEHVQRARHEERNRHHHEDRVAERARNEQLSDFDAPSFSRQTKDPRESHGMEPILAWDHAEDLPEGEFVFIPRLDVQLSGGPGKEQIQIDLVKENPQAFRTEWIRLMRLKPNKLAAMRATGESMEPTIHAGDSLLVDTSQTDVVDGKVYALWYDGGERVKRLFRLPGGGLRIKSDNPEFTPIDLSAEYSGHVRVIGRVVHRSGIGGL